MSVHDHEEGDANDKVSSDEVKLLVTVGSTNFATLTNYICSSSCLHRLQMLGISHTTVQYGTHAPATSGVDVEMQLETFGYTPSLRGYMEAAGVVVSHAGAGTILEAVDMGKALVVVVNTSLMDNHQTELARAMEGCGCCVVVNENDIERDLIDAVGKVLLIRDRDGDGDGDKTQVEVDEKRKRVGPIRNRGAFSRVVAQELAQ